MIQAGLNEMKESSTLVKAEYLKSGSDVTGFILNGRDLSPRDFIEHVEGQLSRPIPSQMLPYPYAETSGTTTQSNGATGTATQPTAGTAGQKRSLEFGVVSDPKRPETSIGADSLSGEVERSGVLGDLSLPFPEVPEYIPPLPESFSIEPR